MVRTWLQVLPGLIGILIAACSSTEAPIPGPPGLRFVAGITQSDTIGALLAQPLVLEVRDSAGFPADTPHVLVRSANGLVGDSIAQSSPNLFVGDHTGRVRIWVRLGSLADSTVVTATTTGHGRADSARTVFTVHLGQPAGIVMSVRDSTAYPGSGYAIGAGRSPFLR